MEQQETNDNLTCANCHYLHAVRFGRKNLFFCKKQEGGEFGKRRPREGATCEKFVPAGNKRMPRIDSKRGEQLGGLKR